RRSPLAARRSPLASRRSPQWSLSPSLSPSLALALPLALARTSRRSPSLSPSPSVSRSAARARTSLSRWHCHAQVQPASLLSQSLTRKDYAPIVPLRQRIACEVGAPVASLRNAASMGWWRRSVPYLGPFTRSDSASSSDA